MKSRFVHLSLIVSGVLLAVLTALSSSLSAWPAVGIVVAALIAGATSGIKALGGLGVQEVAVVQQVLHVLGSGLSVAVPVLTTLAPFLPAGTKAAMIAAVVLPYLGSFNIAFSKGTGALPAAVLPEETKAETPTSKGNAP